MRIVPVAVLAVSVVASSVVATACDAAMFARAERAERDGVIGSAIELRTALAACPAGASTVSNLLALARDHATLGDVARSAELVEEIASRTPRDAMITAAMEEATGYRLALRDAVRAEADASWLLASDEPAESSIALAFDVGTSLETLHRWTEATQWYQHLVTRFPGRTRWAVQTRALVGLGRSYEALGDVWSASRRWRAALDRWPVARDALGLHDVNLVVGPVPRWVPPRRVPPPPPIRAGELVGGASGIVSPYGRVTESGVDDPDANGSIRDEDARREPFAEAAFRLAMQGVVACANVPARPYTGPASNATWQAWADEQFAPWIRFQQACIDANDRNLVAVVNLHVPQWEIAAVATLSHQYLAFAEAVRSAPRLPVPPPAELLDAWQ